MDIEVTPKKWYVVSGATGSTVSKPDGTVVATVPEGGQTAFLATTHTVVTSNAKVEVVESTFNFALALLDMQGEGNITPRGYLPALFLESTGEQYINTGVPLDHTCVIECVSQRGDVASAIYGARKTNGTDEMVLWSGCSTVRWGSWQLGVSYNLDYKANPIRYDVITTRHYNSFEINGDVVASALWPDQEWNSVYTCLLFALHDVGKVTNLGTSRIWLFKLQKGGQASCDFTPSLDENGIPCMFDKITKQPFYRTGDGEFIVGMTAEQARLLCFLPYTDEGSLTVSLPATIVDGETVTDATVQAALDAAAAKGWTITIRTYTES